MEDETELTEEQKEKIAKALTELEESIEEIKPQCTNDVQKRLVAKVEEFLDSFRKKP